MTSKFNNFEVETQQKMQTLSSQIAVPQSIKNDKPSNYKWEFRTKEITVLKLFSFRGKGITKNIFNLIELIETLKGYSSKKIKDQITYEFECFSAKIANKNEIPKLMIKFENFNPIYFDYLECAILASKFQKSIQRCEPWQEQEA